MPKKTRGVNTPIFDREPKFSFQPQINEMQIKDLASLGFILPLQTDDANLLFQIIDRRYEKKNTIVTSNINFDEWATILHDERVANAIVDRLLHHAYVICITGDSYRLRNHMQQKE